MKLSQAQLTLVKTIATWGILEIKNFPFFLLPSNKYFDDDYDVRMLLISKIPDKTFAENRSYLKGGGTTYQNIIPP